MVTLVAEKLHVALGGREVLSGIDCSLSDGGLIGVIGPNGAGKSTFIRALLGLIPAASGRILLDAQPIKGMAGQALARALAYLPQGQTLHWPLTVSRLVALGRLPHLAPLSRITAADQAAVERAMHITDVAALRDRIVTELSGGERARVLLARALAVEAPALIADEPLTSLDPAHQLQVMELLANTAATGALVIAVLHDLGIAARYCSRLLLVDRGRIVADGTPDEVLTPANLAASYGIEAWVGMHDGQRMLVPLRRI